VDVKDIFLQKFPSKRQYKGEIHCLLKRIGETGNLHHLHYDSSHKHDPRTTFDGRN